MNQTLPIVADALPTDTAALQGRLFAAEAKAFEQRTQAQEKMFFALLVALVLTTGAVVSWLAEALGVDMHRLATLGLPVALGVTALAGLVVIVLVGQEIRQSRRDLSTLRLRLSLQTELASRRDDPEPRDR